MENTLPPNTFVPPFGDLKWKIIQDLMSPDAVSGVEKWSKTRLWLPQNPCCIEGVNF